MACMKPIPTKLHPSPSHLHQSLRHITKVRLKWVKNRGLDHIIDRDTDIKAASLLLNLLSSQSPHHPLLLTPSALSHLKRSLGLTVPPLRFLRRYPSLFLESPHPRFPSLPSFSLSPSSLLLLRRQSLLHSLDSPAASLRLARLLMISRSRSLPLRSLSPLSYDLALPPDFPHSLLPSRPDLFRLADDRVSLVNWPSDLAVSALQLRHADSISNPSYRDFKSGAPLSFVMSFPRGYGARKAVKAWMEEFHRLPYFSPYEDWSGIDPGSELMEKRTVGVLHEILSLMVHRKTKRNYIRGLREEFGLPERFTRVFTRYPGIFYLSMKCGTTTVVLREGYRRGRLVDPHPIAGLRDKLFYVMRTGILYRGKGMTKLVLDEDDGEGGLEGGNEGCDDDEEDDEDEDEEDEEGGCYGDEDDESESGSDED